MARQLTSEDVLECLTWLMVTRGVSDHIRSDNGPQFTAKVVREWLKRVGVKTLFIEPGSPWENGNVESLNGKLADELLEREVFYTLQEARVLIERWRVLYNTIRPHSALGYRPPAPVAIVAAEAGYAPHASAAQRTPGWTNIDTGTTFGGRSVFWARPRTSRPAGMVPSWIGQGFLKPAAQVPRTRASSSPNRPIRWLRNQA